MNEIFLDRAARQKREIGCKIKEVRDRRGVSQEKLAEELGFSRIKLNRVENGRAELSAIELDLLADACRVQISYFFE